MKKSTKSYLLFMVLATLAGTFTGFILDRIFHSISGASATDIVESEQMDFLSMLLGPGLFSSLFIGNIVWFTSRWNKFGFLISVVPMSAIVIGSFFVEVNGAVLMPIFAATMWTIVTLIAITIQRDRE